MHYNLKLKQIAIAVIASVLLFTSCKQEQKSLTLVPNDTDLIGVVDLFSLIKKGELRDIDNLEFVKFANEEMRSESKKISRFFNNLKEDPRITGINFQKDIVMYYINDARDERFTCIASELSDSQKFGDFLREMFKTTETDIDIIEEQGYKFASLGREANIVWDNDRVLMIIATSYSSRKNLSTQVENLFNLKETENITANAEFNKFYQNKKDISIYINTNILSEMSREYAYIMKQMDYDFSDSHASMYLDFQDKAISVKTDFVPNEEVAKMMSQNNVKINSDLAKFAPKRQFATIAYSMNPNMVLDKLKEQDDYNRTAEMIKTQTGIELENIVNNIGGTALFGLYNFEKQKYFYKGYDFTQKEDGTYSYDFVEKEKETIVPIMGMIFDIKGKDVVDKLITKLPEEEFTKNGNHYEFKFDNKFKSYMVYNDKYCLITNSKEAVDAFEKGGYTPNLSDTDMVSNMSNKNMYAWLDLAYENYPANIKDEFTGDMNDKQKDIFNLWNDLLKDAEYKQINNTSFELRINTQNKGNNSLRAIIETIDENFKLMKSM
jgi:hypothetical protein